MDKGQWKKTGYWTWSSYDMQKWIEVLIDKNIDFRMTAKRDRLGTVSYIFWTNADMDLSKRLIEKHGFYNEFPFSKEEGL